MKPYDVTRRVRRLEVVASTRRPQPDPRYHDARLEALTIGELEALESLFDREGEAVTWDTCEAVLDEYRRFRT